MTLEHHTVLGMLQKGLEKAESLHIDISISIVDQGGHLLGGIHTTNASYLANEVSLKKAKTAGAFAMSTNVIGEVIQKNPFMKGAFESFESIFYFGGGVPIFENDVVIGGIGVSGVDPMKDNELAEFILSSL